MEEKKPFVLSEKGKALEEAAAGVQEKRPGAYQSAWESQLQDVMTRILNREPFQYSLNGDALYRQYREQAVRNGRLAMADTMGQAAALTGGYGNSYAQSAGQQAYQRQLDSLSGRIPELYALALEQYRQQSAGLQQKYDLLSGAEKQDYARYQDSLTAWQKEADALWQAYLDQRSFDYDSYRDDIADQQWQAGFDESKRRYDQEWEAKQPKPVTVVYRTAPEKKEDTKKTSLVSNAISKAASLLRK